MGMGIGVQKGMGIAGGEAVKVTRYDIPFVEFFNKYSPALQIKSEYHPPQYDLGPSWTHRIWGDGPSRKGSSYSTGWGIASSDEGGWELEVNVETWEKFSELLMRIATDFEKTTGILVNILVMQDR